MKLVARRGLALGLEFALDSPQLVIGRERSADIAIPDEKVSRRHAEIRLAGEQILITDLGSRNGTFVNGERIAGTRLLHTGDMIGIGDAVFSLQEGLAQANALSGAALGASAAGAGFDQAPAVVPKSNKLAWVLGGLGVLIVIAVLIAGGVLIFQSNQPDARPIVILNPTATATITPEPVDAATPTDTATDVSTPTPEQTPAPGTEIAPTSTVRVTATAVQGQQPQSGTSAPQTPPYTVSWSPGRYEGWADGRRMSSDLTIKNISLPQMSPPYSPYFIISDANGNMRVGELHDYSSSSNRLPTLAPGQSVFWTWFTTMSNREWVRGSVFRYAGWNWAQEFNPDGSLSGPPRVISDQAAIPFLPVQIPPEQLATVFPTAAP